MYGGAIATDGGDLTVNHGYFKQNSASTEGGAVYNSSDTVALRNTTFTGEHLTRVRRGDLQRRRDDRLHHDGHEQQR